MPESPAPGEPEQIWLDEINEALLREVLADRYEELAEPVRCLVLQMSWAHLGPLPARNESGFPIATMAEAIWFQDVARAFASYAIKLRFLRCPKGD